MSSSLLNQAIYTVLSSLVIIFFIAVSFVVGTFILIQGLYYLLPGAKNTGEGVWGIGAITFGLSPLIALLGLVPAYWISMKLAEWLRTKHSWEIRHPRRLFVLALILPILFLIFSAAFLRQS